MANVPLKWKKIGSDGKVEINAAENSTFTSSSPALKINGNGVLTGNFTVESLTATSIDTGLQTTDIGIANGDKLVVTDNSNSHKLRRTSLSFDGSTTSKALTKKGTFETFLQSHQSVVNNNPTLSWGTTSTVGTIGGTALSVKMPSAPASLTYTLTMGDSNGQVKMIPSSGSAYNVGVKGLGSSAYQTASSSNTANTVVMRDANKYIYAQYYNQASGEESSATNPRPCIIDASGWHRKFSISSFRNLLGLGTTLLYNGSLSSGSITFNYGNYNYYIVCGVVQSGGSTINMVIPANILSGSNLRFCISDEIYYITFNMSYSGSTATLSFYSQNNGGAVTKVFGAI